MLNLVQIRPLVLRGKWVKYNQNTPFWELSYRLQVRLDLISHLMAQTTQTNARGAFWGFVDIATHLGVIF